MTVLQKHHDGGCGGSSDGVNEESLQSDDRGIQTRQVLGGNKDIKTDQRGGEWRAERMLTGY